MTMETPHLINLIVYYIIVLKSKIKKETCNNSHPNDPSLWYICSTVFSLLLVRMRRMGLGDPADPEWGDGEGAPADAGAVLRLRRSMGLPSSSSTKIGS